MAYHVRKPRYNSSPARELKRNASAIGRQVHLMRSELSPSNNDGLVYLAKTAKKVNRHINPTFGLFTVWGNVFKQGYNRGRYGRSGR